LSAGPLACSKAKAAPHRAVRLSCFTRGLRQWMIDSRTGAAQREADMAFMTNARTVKIEWGDCDPAGIVFYPRYFAMFDASTTALFERALGMTKYQFLKRYQAVGYPMLDTAARFLKPARFGDSVVIETSIAKLGRSSFEVAHRLTKDGELAVECSEKRVWVIRDPDDAERIKSHAIPDEIVRGLSAAA
jgi:4-hydroxybenzoyl-CoA thioesterase